ncbi:MAG: hypothetical protein KGR17_10280, partial [Acidobacteria bacterium]|nr:hypothetical protein [Acidobacteriota bacterium]
MVGAATTFDLTLQVQLTVVLVLPALSVERIWTVWLPVAGSVITSGLWQALNSPPSTEHVASTSGAGLAGAPSRTVKPNLASPL